MSASFALSALDEERFGIRSARAEVASLEDLDVLEGRCRDGRVVFSVVRVPTSSLAVVHEMERRSYFLTDTLLYLDRDLTKGDLPELTGKTVVRPIKDGEAGRVKEVSASAFAGYFGHYHADPKFSKDDCDDIYADWAYRGCLDRRVADQVLVAEIDGDLVGFCLIKVLDDQVGDGTLYGVHPGYRGRGAYRDLVVAAMNWARDKCCTRMVESTQVTNLASQKVWARLGFEPFSSYYTFHRWFQEHQDPY
jgi:GNAT superfamily N-acetyltransferase